MVGKDRMHEMGQDGASGVGVVAGEFEYIQRGQALRRRRRLAHASQYIAENIHAGS